ncbi:hypothetical protein EC950183_3181, partial [Escherichia coli 95.0183]
FHAGGGNRNGAAGTR